MNMHDNNIIWNTTRRTQSHTFFSLWERAGGPRTPLAPLLFFGSGPWRYPPAPQLTDKEGGCFCHRPPVPVGMAKRRSPLGAMPAAKHADVSTQHDILPATAKLTINVVNTSGELECQKQGVPEYLSKLRDAGYMHQCLAQNMHRNHRSFAMLDLWTSSKRRILTKDSRCWICHQHLAQNIHRSFPMLDICTST